MSDEGILDTNTIILLPRLSDSAVLPVYPLITTITLAELATSPLSTRDEDERAVRQRRLLEVEAQFNALPFDDKAARTFGKVSSDLRRSGRKLIARAFDALIAAIAAIAISNRLPLYTVNGSDFKGIEDLELIEIDHPDQ